jgi:hypothetical protein
MAKVENLQCTLLLRLGGMNMRQRERGRENPKKKEEKRELEVLDQDL